MLEMHGPSSDEYSRKNCVANSREMQHEFYEVLAKSRIPCMAVFRFPYVSR